MSLAMLNDAGLGPYVRPFKVDVIGDVGRVLWVLMGTVGVVLLIACANIANLAAGPDGRATTGVCYPRRHGRQRPPDRA